MDELKLNTAVCGIDCFNCEFFYKNIDLFFEKMSEERKAGFTAHGMIKEKLSCKGFRVSGCTASA